VLLADEVGLGKTIEACLALKEYWIRGLVSKALILTPPSLVGQWVDELTSKVRQRAYRARLTAIEYDLVVVDEAHVLKNRGSAAWQFVNELKKRFLLLLSATPIGNDLSELYNLILLLKPGLLKTETLFRRDFGGLTVLQQPDRRDRLRALLREVMIRNTRDPSKAGFYTIVLSVPAHTTIAAHSHRDDRMATVVSGAWQFGYGDHFDEPALKSLPPGSVYSEPGGVNHFARTGAEPVLVQISGFGPTDTRYFDPADTPKVPGDR
jgi:quercetin dioxygenase-like cupin family protein